MVWFGYSVGAGWFTKTMSYGVTDAKRRGDAARRFRGALFQHGARLPGHPRGMCSSPSCRSPAILQRAMRGGPAYAWEPDKGAHVGVMARDAGVETMRWFATDACYVFHPMNAWEEGDDDLRRRDGISGRAAVPQRGRFHAASARPRGSCAGPSTSRRRPTRSSASRSTTWPANFRASTNGARACATGTAGSQARANGREGGAFDCIAHVDLKTGKRTTYGFAAGDAPGEPVFVPRSADASEGDGWMIAVVYRGAEDRSDFVVFDAGAIEAGPIGAAKLPRRVPFGFHGNWRPA